MPEPVSGSTPRPAPLGQQVGVQAQDSVSAAASGGPPSVQPNAVESAKEEYQRVAGAIRESLVDAKATFESVIGQATEQSAPTLLKSRRLYRMFNVVTRSIERAFNFQEGSLTYRLLRNGPAILETEAALRHANNLVAHMQGFESFLSDPQALNSPRLRDQLNRSFGAFEAATEAFANTLMDLPTLNIRQSPLGVFGDMVREARSITEEVKLAGREAQFEYRQATGAAEARSAAPDGAPAYSADVAPPPYTPEGTPARQRPVGAPPNYATDAPPSYAEATGQPWPRRPVQDDVPAKPGSGPAAPPDGPPISPFQEV